jgi:metabotropic glutamate receptor 2/3
LLQKNFPLEYKNGEKYTLCDDSLRLSDKSASYEQESKSQFVIDAVYAFAYALHNLYQGQADECTNKYHD